VPDATAAEVRVTAWLVSAARMICTSPVGAKHNLASGQHRTTGRHRGKWAYVWPSWMWQPVYDEAVTVPEMRYSAVPASQYLSEIRRSVGARVTIAQDAAYWAVPWR